MADGVYAYSGEPTRNPLRFLLALWRTVRDPTNTHEVAIVETTFALSRLGRRFSRWEEVVQTLQRDPRTARAFRDRRPADLIDLATLAQLPAGTLGRTFADHCRARDLNPNLAHVAPGGEVEWMLQHTFQTHDVWHVVTGWGNDEIGEYGLGAFYTAQLGGPPFFGFLLAVAALSTVFRRRSIAEFMEAIVAGYEMGKRAEPLFGSHWSELWSVPLSDVRERFGIAGQGLLGEGIRAAA